MRSRAGRTGLRQLDSDRAPGLDAAASALTANDQMRAHPPAAQGAATETALHRGRRLNFRVRHEAEVRGANAITWGKGVRASSGHFATYTVVNCPLDGPRPALAARWDPRW